jgi:hypothetical protein
VLRVSVCAVTQFKGSVLFGSSDENAVGSFSSGKGERQNGELHTPKRSEECFAALCDQDRTPLLENRLAKHEATQD